MRKKGFRKVTNKSDVITTIVILIILILSMIFINTLIRLETSATVNNNSNENNSNVNNSDGNETDGGEHKCSVERWVRQGVEGHKGFCSCGEEFFEPHDWSDNTGICTKCQYECNYSHDKLNENECIYVYIIGGTSSNDKHTIRCSQCNKPLGAEACPILKHEKDETYHTIICRKGCSGYPTSQEKHEDYWNNGVCTGCGYVCQHKNQIGNSCGICGQSISEECEHIWASFETRATCLEDGAQGYHCSKCDSYKDITVIPALRS